MDINQFMPWIVALLIGILSLIVTIIVNRSQQKVSIKNIENQQEIAVKNIENQTNLSKQVINRDILSKNRQEWINTLRESVSGYLSSHELSKLILQFDKKGKETPPEYRAEFKTWQSLLYKIELLLNPNEGKSRKLIDLMTQLNLSTDYHSMSKENEYEKIKNEIIHVTQTILKEEWERVKKIQ
jgi:hypothetical protein